MIWMSFSCFGGFILLLILGVWRTGSLPVWLVLFEAGFVTLIYGVPGNVGGAWKTIVVICACIYGTGLFEFVVLGLLQSQVLLLVVNFANETVAPGTRARFARFAQSSQQVSFHRFLVVVNDRMEQLHLLAALRVRQTSQTAVPEVVYVNTGEGARQLECPYCCDRRRNRVMNCGHTGCDRCVEKFETCPECRTVVFRVQPMFF
jgi:hypothetical protein